jgi:hypothetical protein
MENDTINDDILKQIFDFQTSDNITDSYNLLIIEKIMTDPQILNYLPSCYMKSLSYPKFYNNLVTDYLVSYATGAFDPEHKTNFINWIIDNDISTLPGLMEKLIEKLTKPELKIFINTIFDAVKAKDAGNSKYKIIKTIFSIEQVRRCAIITHKVHKNGESEQEKGIFRWIRSVPFDSSVKEILEAIDPFTNDMKNLPYLCKLLNDILVINKPYTFSDLRMIDIKRCSSGSFMYCIFNIIMHIYFKCSADKVKKYETQFPRTEFTFNKTDDLATQIFIMACRAFTICYTPQLRIYNHNKQQAQEMKKLIREGSNMMGLLINTGSLKNKLKLLEELMEMGKQLIEGKEYIKTVDSFLISIINQKESPINDAFIDSFIFSLTMKEAIYGKVDICDELFDYIIQIISGLTKNPSIKFTAAILINNIINYGGYRHRHTKLLFCLLKYLSEVDFFQLTDPQNAHLHFRNMLTHISAISIRQIDSNENQENKIEENLTLLFKGIHKICSKNIGFIDFLTNHCKEIEARPQLMNHRAGIKYELLPMINCNLNTIINSYRTLFDIIKNIVKNVDKLSRELIMPVVSMVTGTLTFLCDGKNPIYSVYERNMETLEVLNTAFEVMNLIKDNREFKNEIYEFLGKVTEMLPRVKLNKKTKEELINYFDNFNFNEIDYIDSNDLPDEFKDPILCIPIKDPIMIPNVQLIFDKTSIISQLYHDKINPYTREEMTVEQVEKYNSEDNIKKQIQQFKAKFNEWLNQRGKNK